LREAGHFPSSALSVTGNARLDQLVAQCGALKPMRDALRREFCSTEDQPLAVLAAKFNEIQGVLGDLATAVNALPGMRLIIKPHPAETPDEYAALTAATPNISIADAATDLARLLTAADAIVTMNSTVAIDGLVLGLPSLVIGTAEQPESTRGRGCDARCERRRRHPPAAARPSCMMLRSGGKSPTPAPRLLPDTSWRLTVRQPEGLRRRFSRVRAAPPSRVA
jgi:hypothetical protein